MSGRLIATLAAALSVALVAPSSATAATEVGDDCGATVEEAATYVNVPDQKAADASPLPVAAPVGGVVTAWRLKSLSGATTPVQMGVFRPTATTGRFLFAAASEQETLAFGANSFRTRIPVAAGDRFGLIPIDNRTVSCITGNSDDHSWSYPEVPEVGSEYQFASGVFVRVPVVAVIEPDVDGDGYGDETQDGCPQSARTIAPCPPVTSTFRMKPKKRSIIARVRVSSPASVQVFGSVSWQVRGKPKTRAPKTSARNHTLIVLISAGRPRPMAAGETKTFRLGLSKPILRRLGRLTPRQALRALITVRTTDAADRVSDHRRRLKLKGRQRG